MYYGDGNYKYEGKICLFDSQSYSVEQIGKFSNRLINPYEVATTSDKVNSYDFVIELIHMIQIFVINSYARLFEIFDLKTKQISKGPTVH